MATLMGKFKTNEWKELDHTDSDSPEQEQEQKDFLLQEYRNSLGQGWMFKFVDEPVLAAV